MADKAATVYVVDLGASMRDKRNGRNETDLDFALKYVWDRILTTVSNGRKTDTVGVVGFRTDATDNEFYEDESYINISVLHPISQFLMAHVREVKELFQPSRTNRGDGVSALVVAISMITKFTRELKYIRKIVFVSNGTGIYDPDGLEDIAEQLKAKNIELTVLGVDFDDAEYGFKEEGKDPRKAVNEQTLQKLCEDSGGLFGTLEEAVSELGRPRLKKVRPVASFKGKLMLGDLENSESALGIDIERYPRTMQAKPISSNAYVDAPGHVEGSSGENEGLQAVKTERTYVVADPDAPGGKRTVKLEELEKGYMYGRTVVPISKTDEAVVTLETQPGLQLIGFVTGESYRRYYSMSSTNIIVAQKANTMAALALSSLVHALYELESYAIARLVKKENAAPVMVMLAPMIDIDNGVEGLLDVELPFAEDVRPYQFPPLGEVKSATGKMLDKHRFIPTPELEKCMGDYVDAMDLTTLEGDDEYAAPEDTFSPIVHRTNQVVRHRALHPDDEILPCHEILLKYSHPPKELVEKSKKQLEKLIAAADVKKVPLKAQGTKRKREQPKPKSGLDIDEILGGKSVVKKTKISRENAIPEFKRKIEATDSDEDFKDACHEMLVFVKELITHSLADANYQRVCEMLGVVRSEMVEYDFPDFYNDTIRDLKEAIVKGELDGDRMDMWEEIRKNSLGLIVSEESDSSKVTKEEVNNFL